MTLIKKQNISSGFWLSIFYELKAENSRVDIIYAHIGFTFTTVRKFIMMIPVTIVAWSETHLVLDWVFYEIPMFVQNKICI